MAPVKQAEIPVFDISQVQEELTEDAKRIMEMLKEKVFYISEYQPVSRFDDTIRTLSETMCYGFEHKEFRDYPVQYKFNKDDKKEQVKFMSFRHFIINMIMWRPQICLDPDGLNDNLIISSSQMTKIGPKLVKNYFDENYVEKYNRFIPNDSGLPIYEINSTLSEILGETTFIIQQVVNMFTQFFGITINIETFADLAKRNPKIDELMHFKLDELKQPAEMEKDAEHAMAQFEDEIINDSKFTSLKPLMITKCTNRKQVMNMAINGALKPDFDGNTIPKPINTNFLAGGGFRDLIDWYINSISGRKAAIINNEFMGKTGHLLILIAIATANVRLSKTTLDCHSINTIPVEIKTKKYLQKMDGRRYRHRGEKEFHILNYKKDENLLGETLEFRSPITCSCKDGVCRECYGELYYTNIDNVVTGIYSATTVMNPVVQGILSAKHHQSTNTAPIVFREEFDQFFALASTDIVLDIDPDIDASEYSVLIRREDIHMMDGEELDLSFDKKKKRRKKIKDDDSEDIMSRNDYEDDDDEEDSDLGMRYYVTKFEVAKNLHKKGVTPEYIEFSDVDNKEMFIHNDFIIKMSGDSDSYGEYLYIDFEDISTEEFIFMVEASNREVSHKLKMIQRALNNKDHEGCTTYQDLTNKMLDLIIDSNLDAMNIHAEMIIRELVRRKTNILKRPDFNKLIMSNDYDLVTITTALKKNPAITTSLSTPYLKQQLVNLGETFVKEATSVFDPFFKPCLVDQPDPMSRRHHDRYKEYIDDLERQKKEKKNNKK